MNDKLRNITQGTEWAVRESLDQDVFNLYRISVSAQTRILHNEGVQDLLTVDMPVGFVFVSNLKFQPKISGSKLDAIRKIVIIKSKDKFKEMLENNNIKDVHHEGSGKREIKGTQVNTHKYSGTVNIEDMSYSVVSYCMIFHNGHNYYVVGMAEPASDLEDIFDISRATSFEPSEIASEITKRTANHS